MRAMAEPFPIAAWEDAPLVLLSCPGPLRRHHAAIVPAAQLALPQVLLGYEAQLAAFAAAMPASPTLLFTPLPELFSGPESLVAFAPHLPAGGDLRRAVHCRFGSARVARVMKPARNAVVMAEQVGAPPLTTSAHPLASGRVVPAAVRRGLAFAPPRVPLTTTAGRAVRTTVLPPAWLTADLARARQRAEPVRAESPGLDLVSFAEFSSGPWASGPVRATSPHLRAAMRDAARTGGGFVLLPWNLDDPGSVVPELLIRLAAVQDPRRPALRPCVLPFNYPGQIGLMRRLIQRVRNAAAEPAPLLANLFVARLSRLAGLPLLLRLASIAWVDGNDPEHDWTVRRLHACGIATILLDTGLAEADGRRVVADETIWVEAETRWGLLHCRSRLPSRRALPALLAETEACRAALAQPARRPARPARTGASLRLDG